MRHDPHPDHSHARTAAHTPAAPVVREKLHTGFAAARPMRNGGDALLALAGKAGKSGDPSRSRHIDKYLSLDRWRGLRYRDVRGMIREAKRAALPTEYGEETRYGRDPDSNTRYTAALRERLAGHEAGE